MSGTATRNRRAWVDWPTPTTPDEEKALSAIIRAGGPGWKEARDRLASAHIALARLVAVRLGPRCGLDADDAFGVGQVALLNAAKGYDSRKGYRFVTYAARSIERAIRQESNRSVGPVSVPVNSHLHRDNPYAEQAKAGRHAAWDIDDVFVEAPGEDDRGPDGERIRRLVAMLPPRQRKVIEAHYGLTGEPKPIVAIARETGTSRETVRCARDEGLRSLRKLAGVGGAA